jgi:hypothetical protein
MVEDAGITDDGSESRHGGDISRRQVLGWTLGTTAVVGAVAAGVLASREPTVATPAKAQADPQLEGSWYANFNTVPPTPTPALFRITFVPNGGLIIAYPPLRPQPDGRLLFVTDGVGAWARTGPREFSFTYAIDVHEARREPPPPLNPRIETHTVWASFSLDQQGDRWEGTWKRQNVDLAGNIVGGLDGRVFATRLVVTPMP